MSRAGQTLAMLGLLRTTEGPSLILAQSGAFASMVRLGVGTFEVTMDPEFLLAPSDVIIVDLNPAIANMASAVERVSEAVFVVRTTLGGQLEDLFDLTISISREF